MSPLRKQKIFTKRVILDKIFIFRDSMMPEYQLIEENEKVFKRDFFGFVCFRSGPNNHQSMGNRFNSIVPSKLWFVPLFFCVFMAIPFAKAHHYKGLPHYNYFDNYPQVPILEYIEETPDYEAFVTIYNFQGLDLGMVEAPNDVRFYVYLYNIEKGSAHLGPVNFDIYSHGKLIHKFVGMEQEEESIYTLRSTIKEQDDLLLKITFINEEGEEVVIDMEIEITESFWDKYGLYFAILSFFGIVGVIKKSTGT